MKFLHLFSHLVHRDRVLLLPQHTPHSQHPTDTVLMSPGLTCTCSSIVEMSPLACVRFPAFASPAVNTLLSPQQPLPQYRAETTAGADYLTSCSLVQYSSLEGCHVPSLCLTHATDENGAYRVLSRENDMQLRCLATKRCGDGRRGLWPPSLGLRPPVPPAVHAQGAAGFGWRSSRG